MKETGTLLAETIKKEVALSGELLKESFQHYYKAGELLSELKELIEESSFESWLTQNCNLNIKEAKRLINFYSGAKVTLTVQRDSKTENSTRKEKGTAK